MTTVQTTLATTATVAATIATTETVAATITTPTIAATLTDSEVVAAVLTTSTIEATVSTDTVAATIETPTVSVQINDGDGRKVSIPAIGALKIAGHSYLPHNTSYLDDNDDNLARTLRRIFGTRPEGYHNMALAGGAVSDHTSSSSWSKVVADCTPTRTFPYSPDCGLAVVSYGTNDAIIGTATNERTGYKESMKTVFSRLLAAATFDNDSSTVSGGAGWTNTDHGATDIGGGTGNWVSPTVGAVLTITVPSDFEGGWVGLIFPGAYAGGTATIAVDGVADGTVSTGNMHSSIYSGKFAATTYRTRLTAGTHTITVTVASQINSGSVYFNGWHIEAAPSSLLAVMENVTPSSPGGVWAGIDAARQATYNEWLTDAVADFNADTDDSPVFLVPLEDDIAADPAYFATDGLHPNARGATLMAEKVWGAVYDRLRNGNATVRQLAGYWGDADPEVSFDWLRSDWDVHAWVDDTFTRDDDATALGTGESGHEWTVVDSTGVAATLGISSDQAYLPAGSTRTIATTETGSPDGEWMVDIGAASSVDQRVGSVMRFVDAGNYIALEAFPNFATMGLYLRRNGGATLLGDTGFSGTGGEWNCVLQGDTVRVYDNGTLVLTVTDERFLEFRSSKHGFFIGHTDGRVDGVEGKHYTPVVTDWLSNHMHPRAATAAYTLVLADNDRVVEVNSASPLQVTVPTSSVPFPVGARVDIIQIGAGAVTIAGDSGVTVRTSSTLVLAQYQRGTLHKRSATEWIFSKWA